jgi:plastocyanin
MIVPGAGLLLTVAVLVAPGSAAAGGGGCHEAVTTGHGIEVAIERFCYSPTVLRATVGSEVTWTNLGGVPHTVSGVLGSWGSRDPIANGESASFGFPDPGVFLYFCAIHPTMQGAVVVAEPPADTATEVTPAAITADVPPPPAEGAAAPIASFVVVAAGGMAFGLTGATVAPALLRRRRERRDVSLHREGSDGTSPPRAV